MARYRIIDPNSSRTTIISGDTLPSEQDIDQIFTNQTPSSAPSQPGLLPVIKNEWNKLNAEAEKGFVRNNQGKIIGRSEYGKQQDKQVMDMTMGSAVGMAGLSSGIASKIKATLPLITKSGAANAMEQAATKATETGKSIPWDVLTNRIKEAVTSKYGESTTVRRALTKFLGEQTPAGQLPDISNPQLNPQDLLKMRRVMSTQIPTGYFSKLVQSLTGQAAGGSQLDASVANEGRRVVSTVLKDLAPEIKTPDALYSFYSKIHGDAPTWAKRLIVTHLASELLPKNMRGPLTDILGAALGAAGGL